MFVDQIEIEVTAGKGGDGIVAYRRENSVEKGGPFGGNGGNGGSVIFVAEEGLSTLLDFRYMRHVKGEIGERGKTKGAYGACAKDTIVKVPLGTVVYDQETGKVIADISKKGQQVVVCKGGRGGRGNMSFANGTNKCPDWCEKGEPGEHKMIRLELKVLADCGLVGFPSVGKSTLISAVSAVRPKIASYHFTTLAPNLGMVYVEDGRSFVMADLPGLIEGASQGLGLGFQFLRHIERCRVIVHVVDISASEGRDPYDDYVKIRKELEEYQTISLSQRLILLIEADRIGKKGNDRSAINRMTVVKRLLNEAKLAPKTTDGTIGVGTKFEIKINRDGVIETRQAEMINQAISDELDCDYIERISPLGYQLFGLRTGDSFTFREGNKTYKGCVSAVVQPKEEEEMLGFQYYR